MSGVGAMMRSARAMTGGVRAMTRDAAAKGTGMRGTGGAWDRSGAPRGRGGER